MAATHQAVYGNVVLLNQILHNVTFALEAELAAVDFEELWNSSGLGSAISTLYGMRSRNKSSTR